MRCSEQWEWRKRAERRASVEESLSANDRSLWLLLLLLLLSFWLCPSLFANQTLQITRFENITPKIYLSCRDGAIPDRDTNFGPFFALSLFPPLPATGHRLHHNFIIWQQFSSSFSLSFFFCPVLCFVSVGRLQFFSFTFFLPTSSLRLIPLHFGQWLGKSCLREKVVKSW